MSDLVQSATIAGFHLLKEVFMDACRNFVSKQTCCVVVTGATMGCFLGAAYLVPNGGFDPENISSDLTRNTLLTATALGVAASAFIYGTTRLLQRTCRQIQAAPQEAVEAV